MCAKPLFVLWGLFSLAEASITAETLTLLKKGVLLDSNIWYNYCGRWEQSVFCSVVIYIEDTFLWKGGEENAITIKKTKRIGHTVSQLGIPSVLLLYPRKHLEEMRQHR